MRHTEENATDLLAETRQANLQQLSERLEQWTSYARSVSGCFEHAQMLLHTANQGLIKEDLTDEDVSGVCFLLMMSQELVSIAYLRYLLQE